MNGITEKHFGSGGHGTLDRTSAIVYAGVEPVSFDAAGSYSLALKDPVRIGSDLPLLAPERTFCAVLEHAWIKAYFSIQTDAPNVDKAISLYVRDPAGNFSRGYGFNPPFGNAILAELSFLSMFEVSAGSEIAISMITDSALSVLAGSLCLAVSRLP